MSNSFVSKLIAVTAAVTPFNANAQSTGNLIEQLKKEQNSPLYQSGKEIEFAGLKKSIVSSALNPVVKVALNASEKVELDKGVLKFTVFKKLEQATVVKIKQELGVDVKFGEVEGIEYSTISIPKEQFDAKLKGKAEKQEAAKPEKNKLSVISEVLLKKADKVTTENGIVTFDYIFDSNKIDPRAKAQIEKELGIVVEERIVDGAYTAPYYHGQISVPAEVLSQYTNAPSVKGGKSR